MWRQERLQCIPTNSVGTQKKSKTTGNSTCTLMCRRKKNMDELKEFMEAVDRRYVSNNYFIYTILMDVYLYNMCMHVITF